MCTCVGCSSLWSKLYCRAPCDFGDVLSSDDAICLPMKQVSFWIEERISFVIVNVPLHIYAWVHLPGVWPCTSSSDSILWTQCHSHPSVFQTGCCMDMMCNWILHTKNLDPYKYNISSISQIQLRIPNMTILNDCSTTPWCPMNSFKTLWFCNEGLRYQMRDIHFGINILLHNHQVMWHCSGESSMTKAVESSTEMLVVDRFEVFAEDFIEPSRVTPLPEFGPKMTLAWS